MKKYFVNDRGLNWTFDSLEKAQQKAEEIGGKVESCVFWKYYAPYYSAGTSGTREITGKNLESAITANFNQILKDYDMEGLSGHILHYAAGRGRCRVSYRVDKTRKDGKTGRKDIKKSPD